MFSLSHRTTETPHARLLLLGFAFALSVLYDIFFWKQELGIGFVLYICLYVVGFVAFMIYFQQLRQKWAFFLLGPLLVHASALALYNNNFVTHLVPIMSVLLLLIFSLVLPLQNPNKFRFSLLRIPFIYRTSIFFTKVKFLFSHLFQTRSERNREVIKKVGIALLISFPLLLIFAALLSGADAIFSKWLKDVFAVDVQWNWVWRTLRTILLTLVFGGILAVVTGPEHVLEFKAKLIKKFDALIVSIVLGLLNLLFLAFVFIQIKYLFGSAHYVFESGITFAEYARAGFFQLVWVIALSALMMLIVYRSYSDHKAPVFLTMLQILLMVQVGVIAVSALKRMNLYQEAFGFTVLRLYVEWFIYFVIALLIFAGVSIVSRLPFWKFFYGSMLAGVIALTVVGSINVDKVIAAENVRRFQQEGKSIDIVYLTKLSVDAAPTTLSLLLGPVDKLSLGDMLLLQNIFDKTQNQVKKYDTFFEKNRGIEEARIFLKEKGATLQPLIVKMQQEKDSNTIFQKQVALFEASHDSRNCLDQKYNAETGYYINDRICVPVNKTPDEKYLVILQWELNRMDPQGKNNDRYVYKILFETTVGTVKEYREIFSKSFPLVSNQRYTETYENSFFLLNNGVLVEKTPKDYYYLFFKPQFEKEKSILGEQGILKPSVFEQIKNL